MPAFALALAYAGLLLLSLAMDRHHRDVLGRAPKPVRRGVLRWSGAGLVTLSAWPCLDAWGGSVGSVGWCGVLTAAGLSLVLLLAYAPHPSRLLAPLPPLIALAAWLEFVR